MIQRNLSDDATLAYLFNKKAHPVGSLFLTASNADPAKAIGGKWKQRTDITLPTDITAWERIS